MKFKITIFLILFIFASCNQNSKNDIEDNEELEVKPELELSKEKANNDEYIKSKILSKPKQIKLKEEEILQTNNKIKSKEQELFESTKRIILRNKLIPSFRVDSIKNNVQRAFEMYSNLTCGDDTVYSNKNDFSIEFNDEYENSSNLTKLTDGKLFCLRELDFQNTKIAKLIYGRNEGGHTSDAISIVVIDNLLENSFYLPISYITGWDGHETIVESRIDGDKIIRKISERYGWSNMHLDSLAKQPRRVVTQIIKINNGRLELLSENIEKFNIDGMFK